VIQGGVRLLTSTVTNHPTDLGGFVRSFWIKDSQLWFLPFVVVVTALAVAVRPWQSQVQAALTSAATVIVAVLCWGRELPWIGLAGVQLLPFFWAGVLLTADGLRRVWRRVRWVTVALTTLLATGAALWVSDPATTTFARGPITVSSVAAGAVAAVAGTALVLSVSVGISRHRLSAALAGVGERSLEILLSHIVATAGTRVALVAAGVHEPVLHAVLGLLAGIAFPLGLWRLSRAVGPPWLFARPPSTVHGHDR
jgi:fucose 4-O-acetylase-like acetyltransferase